MKQWQLNTEEGFITLTRVSMGELVVKVRNMRENKTVELTLTNQQGEELTGMVDMVA